MYYLNVAISLSQVGTLFLKLVSSLESELFKTLCSISN